METNLIFQTIVIFIMMISALYGLAHGCEQLLQLWKSTTPNQVLTDLKPVIERIILALMMESERKWKSAEKSGEIKEQDVIKRLYEIFPELQDAPVNDTLEMISATINEKMPELREMAKRDAESQTN